MISRPYTCTVSLERTEEGQGQRGLRLVETIQSDGGHIPFVRSIPMGANVDVDAVDGSYSLDDRRGSVASLPLLPSWMLDEGMTGVDHSASMMHVTFLCGAHAGRVRDGELLVLLAVWRYYRQEKDEEEEGQLEETERSYRLLSVILADETKVMPKDKTTDYFESTSRSTNAPPTSPSSSALDLLLKNSKQTQTHQRRWNNTRWGCSDLLPVFGWGMHLFARPYQRRCLALVHCAMTRGGIRRGSVVRRALLRPTLQRRVVRIAPSKKIGLPHGTLASRRWHCDLIGITARAFRSRTPTAR